MRYTTGMSQTPWVLYHSTRETWDAMLEAINSAKKSIDLEQFIFVNDEIGRAFIDACAKKAAEGVRVRFLWDAAGSFDFFGTFLVSDLSDRGIQVAFFNTFIPRTLRAPKWWFFRNHRRSLVIDSEIAFTGSISIWNRTVNWRETTVRLTGDIVKEIERAFAVIWDRANSIKVDWGSDKHIAQSGFNYITNSPTKNRHFIYYRLIDAIRGAQNYIYLTTPYFVPDRRLLRVLRLASRRGVDVRILIPQRSDHKIVDIGAQTFYTSLLKAGVKIYKHSTFIHSKVAIIDGEWSTVGTMNLDTVSLKFNFEANVISTNSDFAEELRTQFTKDLAGAELIKRDDWEKRGSTQRLIEFFVRFIREFL